MKPSKQEKAQAIETLRGILPPGSVVLCNLRHVSRSGMFRLISFYVAEGGNVRDITRLVGLATETAEDKRREGLRVSGCGMDMGFAVVYDLAHTLYPDGFDCIAAHYGGESGEGRVRCPSNDHSNYRDEPMPGVCAEHTSNGSKRCENLNCKPWRHRSGGYAIRHSWI